jgi:hypothetical protein
VRPQRPGDQAAGELVAVLLLVEEEEPFEPLDDEPSDEDLLAEDDSDLAGSLAVLEPLRLSVR